MFNRPLLDMMEWLPDGWVPSVVAVDIDGTITDDHKRINLDAVKALRRLEAHGIPVVLATGNVRPITYGLWRFIGLSGPICCENGGVLWSPEWEEAVLRATKDEAQAAADWLAEQVNGLDPVGIWSNQWRESEWCLKPTEDLEAIQAAMAEGRWSNLEVIRTGFAIHLMDPVISKGQGLAELAERHDWSLDDMLVVGDAPNDLSMFEAAAWSVAVGGAFREVTAAASVSSPHLHGDTFPPLVQSIVDRLSGPTSR